MMPSRDGRSVGELLLDCDLIVRDVLMDTTQMDGRVMVRTWGEVVQAAGDLWRALPEPDTGTSGSGAREPGAVLMEQLQTMSAGLLKAARRRQWPGEGPADERLLQVCENLTTAAELLPSRRTDIRPMRPRVRADLDAAKARLMHVLYVGAHGVQVALNRDLRRVAVIPPSRRAALPAETVRRTMEARDRMAAFEQLAGSYVSRTFPAALRGEHKPAAEPDRLCQALATWDIQAHRALAGTPTAATMSLIAQTEAHTAFATQAILRSAAETGSIDPRQYGTRLAPALESAQTAWIALARTWSPLAPPRARRLDPDLAMAANEIRAATLEIIHDRRGTSSAETLAATMDLMQTCQTLQMGLASATDLAYALREATADPDLLGSARGVNAMAMTLEARGPYGNVATEAWVRPMDHAQDRLVALPDMVRESVWREADHATRVTRTAAGCAALLSAPAGENVAKTVAEKARSRPCHDVQRGAVRPAASRGPRLV